MNLGYEPSLKRQLALNTGVQIAGKVISTGLGIGIIGFMTRTLGTSGFGAYSIANAFLQIFALLLDLGMNVTQVAMLGECTGDEKREHRITSAFFTLRLLLAIAVLGVLAPIVAFIFPYPLELKIAIIALSGSFFFPTLNQVVMGAEQRHLKMHAAAFAENIGRLIVLAGLIYAQTANWTLIPIMWLITLGSFGNFFTNILFARKFAYFGWNWDPAFWKNILSRSWPVGLSIAFGLLYFKADTIILSLYRSQAEVGIYGAAYRILEILITVPFMYAGVLLPILSGAWAKKEKEKFTKLISASIDVMVMMLVPMIVGTWLLGTRLITAVTGPEFASAGPVLSILIVAIGAIYLNTIFSHAVVALDKQRQMISVYAITAIVAVICYFLLIPSYGMWAAAWVTVASETIVGIGSLIVTRKLVPVGYKIKVTLASIAAAGVMAGGIWFVRDAFLPIPVVIAVILYALSLLLFGGVSKETLSEILNFKKKQPPMPPVTG